MTEPAIPNARMPDGHRADLKENGVQRYAFLLVPEFSMMPFTSAIEAMRAANRMSGRTLYTWRTVTLDGVAVTASNGVEIAPHDALETARPGESLVVCAGLNAERYASARLIAALRRISRTGQALGSVCTGSAILAQAGLLDGYRCTIHWEEVQSLAENYPRLDVTNRLFEIDRDRFTCSGGTAPLDLMIHLIGRDFGGGIATQVADLMLHHHSREADEPQRIDLAKRLGVHHAGLLQAIALMEERIETPLPLPRIARAVGLSQRQLERLFHDLLGTTPSRHYLRLRLERARDLANKTTAPIMQIAVSTGFTSAAHFAKCYREHFGHAPSAERRRLP